MSSLLDERMEEMKELISEILELDEDEITETSLFNEDHGADSMRAIEILAALEKKFNVVIAQDNLMRMTHLKGVYEVVAEAAGW
ncbi:acyl carrier protein [Streptosporangium sp. NPDC000396]|uniref:acyl carrier protein n=1 Tax=Streptosporangium sp. NPDC000396 TaxID=3366185 RepID=UPI00369B2067